MKKNAQYLAALRQLMKDHNVAACIVSGTDPHQSELPPAHWRGREWLTAFESENGTNGTAVVTADGAYCWTDSRYFIQATEQLKATGFTMMEEDGPNAVNLIEWVTSNFTPEDGEIAFNGSTFSHSWVEELKSVANEKNLICNPSLSLLEDVWDTRPSRPMNPLFVHDEDIVGETAESKIQRTLAAVQSEGADATFISALDDIAWITNLRTANDIAFSPIYVAFLYLDDNQRVLFIDEEKISPEVREHLNKYNIQTRPYESTGDFFKNRTSDLKVLVDPNKTSHRNYCEVGEARIINGGASVARLKGVKSEKAISHLATAMEKDGVALTRFMMMVEREYPSGTLTEIGLARALRQFRLDDPTCVDESFAPILGWNANGAIVHYEPSEECSLTIAGDGLLLIDSGGQYLYGTTDITRTVGLGNPTPEMKHDFTLVLKGHIALAKARYPKGTRGTQLDVLARQFLWEEGKAYYHGTGHGVGFFINVHEGPQAIRMNDVPVALEPGMITSNEPGLYYEGRYGIRIENLVVTTPWKQTEFGEFYEFKTMTLFPIDTTLIDMEIMTDDEIKWLNDYHAEVESRLTPLLNAEEASWLKAKCAPISK